MNLSNIIKGFVIALFVFSGAGFFFPNAAWGEDAAIVAPLSGPVKTDTVCMVNDRAMGAAQIAVDVEGKTYYGCCAGCSARLQKEASYRFSVDPVTGRKVDKAKAYIMADATGKAVYFEGEESAKKYSASLKPKE